MLNPAAGVAENVSVAIANGEAIAASDSSDPEEVSNNKTWHCCWEFRMKS